MISFHYYNFDWDYIDWLQPECKSPKNGFIYELSSFHICLQVKSRLHKFFFFTHYANFCWTWSQAAALSSNRGDFPLGLSLCPLLKHQLEAKLSSLTHSVGCLKGCSAIQGTYCETWNSTSALCSLKDVSSNPDAIQSSRPETSRNN